MLLSVQHHQRQLHRIACLSIRFLMKLQSRTLLLLLLIQLSQHQNQRSQRKKQPLRQRKRNSKLILQLSKRSIDNNALQRLY